MSFATYETSRSRGAPQTLYKFTYQDQVFAYTDAEQTVTFAGVEYEPIPVARGSVSTSGTFDRVTLTVDVPHDCEIAELFRVFPPSDVVGVTVFQGHTEDSTIDFLAVWTGRVISCARDKTTASLLCEPVSTSMKRPGLRRRYQYGCPHALYGPQCRVVRASFTATATVSAANGATLTLESGWNGAFPEANFVDGMLECVINGATALRTILRVDAGSNQIVVSGKVAGLVAGGTVSLNPGCNHQMSGCNQFNNILNYGGQPWIPTKNPIGFVNQYY